MTEPNAQPDPHRAPASQPSWYGSGSADGANGSSAAGWPDASGTRGPETTAPGPYGRGGDGASPGAYGTAPGSYGAYGGGMPAYTYGGQPLAPGQTAGTGLSVSSMILGIVSLVGGLMLFFPPIVGVVLGHMGLKREPNGRGMAIAGLVMNYISLALLALLVVGFILLIVVMGMSMDAVYNDAVQGLDA
ncbi:DUF4190 domain-containing protein [Micrococcus sp. M4NT]|uniref:DUF4190 domain-containing protein n=1 Tax=Micrococcus sp. M4NT TaxID=2957501 RepID=UPI0029B4BEF2|nr:DUF4190 domain-containing protein [Micrococcus sp. M4NT]MDX2341536.1 DUF4190 domain-containing protein [Micrococcus sp. M4NT]